jgi:hypothetical protein
MFEKLQQDFKGLFGSQQPNDEGADSYDVGRYRISDFFEQWGWDYSVSLIVIDSGLNENDIWDWNVIRFHNKLSYLKDKGKFEITVNKMN